MSYSNSNARPSSAGTPVPPEFQNSTSASRTHKYQPDGIDRSDVFSCTITCAEFAKIHQQNQEAADKRIREHIDRLTDEPPRAASNQSSITDVSQLCDLGKALGGIFPYVDEFPDAILLAKSPWAIKEETELDPLKWTRPDSPDAHLQQNQQNMQNQRPQLPRAPDAPIEMDPLKWVVSNPDESTAPRTLGQLINPTTITRRYELEREDEEALGAYNHPFNQLEIRRYNTAVRASNALAELWGGKPTISADELVKNLVVHTVINDKKLMHDVLAASRKTVQQLQRDAAPIIWMWRNEANLKFAEDNKN